MTVVMFECAMRWTHIHRRPNSKKEGGYLYEEIRTENPNNNLPDMREIFVLRNAIAHGHAWQISDNSPEFTKLGVREDSNFSRCVNSATQLTTSGMHVVPSLMNRQDFKRVLEITTNAYRALIELDLLLPQVLSNMAVWPGGERLTFGNLSERIPWP